MDRSQRPAEIEKLKQQHAALHRHGRRLPLHQAIVEQTVEHIKKGVDQQPLSHREKTPLVDVLRPDLDCQNC